MAAKRKKYWIFRILWFVCFIIAMPILSPLIDPIELAVVWVIIAFLVWLFFFREKEQN
jgi:uncharacterized membrane protein YhaH (DUF805 family)